MTSVKTMGKGEFERLLESIKSAAQQLSTRELHQALKAEIAASADDSFDLVTQERAAFRARLYADTLAQRQSQIARR